MAPPTSRSGHSHLPALIGLAVSLLLLWWALHDVSLGDVWHEVRTARMGWLLAAAATATLTFPIRTIRWRYLLRDQGTVLPLAPMWHATAIGFMANNLLPARAGEVARAYAARSLTGVRFTTAFASVAVERAFDGLFVAGLLVTGFLAGGFTTTATVWGMSLARIALTGAVIFGSVFVAAAAMVWQPAATRRLAHAVLQSLLSERWAERVLGMVDGILDGLSALREPERLGPILFWSLALWLTAAASFALGFTAFRLSLPWGAPLVLQGLVAASVAVPATPGFFGVFEGVTRAALALYGVAGSVAVSLAIGYHIAGFIPITVLGLWSLWRANLRIRDLRQAADAAGARKDASA